MNANSDYIIVDLRTGDPPILTTSPIHRTLHHPQPVKPQPFSTIELEIGHNDESSDLETSDVCFLIFAHTLVSSCGYMLN